MASSTAVASKPKESASQENTSIQLPCFTCTRLNSTTFVIVEDDKWSEIPFIYVKLYSQVLVLFDTGCGGAAKNPKANLTSLRDYIETFPVPDNANQPLNANGERDYIVVISHCHFDHIGGIAQFVDNPKSTILASSFDRPFVEGDGRLPVSSLCQFFDMVTPSYKVTKWVTDGENLTYKGDDLGLQVFHGPGHTPDSIALWDSKERFLFVGDTMYEWARISFPSEGSLVAYSETIGRLKRLVLEWNESAGTEDTPLARVQMACGHVTRCVDGAQFLEEVDAFLFYVLQELVEPTSVERFREDDMVSYERDDGRIGFVAPKKLFEAFRADSLAMESILQRQMVG